MYKLGLPKSDLLPTCGRKQIDELETGLVQGRRGEARFTIWVAIRAAISALRAATEGDNGTRPEGPPSRRPGATPCDRVQGQRLTEATVSDRDVTVSLFPLVKTTKQGKCDNP